MYKKTKPRSVMELLNKNLSEREVAAILGCSRNTVSEIKELCRQQGMTWDDIQDMTDDGLYDILYPKKFKRTTNYVPVDYAYVHSELKKTGVTMKLLWEEYRDKCVSEGREYCAYPTFTVNYYKYTGEKNYTSHIQHKPGVEVEVDWSGPTMSYVDVDTGEIITAYLFVATLPYSQYGYVEATTDMKEKAWLECHVHMFEFFEGTPVKIVCDNLKTGVVSHPKKGEIILNDAVRFDVKYNSRLVFVYYNRSEIARHEILPKGIVNGVRTDESHLPFPLKKNKQAEDLIDAAREIGPNTFELIRRMYDEAKVKEQPTQTVAAILAIADTFTPDILEAACKKSLKQYHMPFYKTVYKAAENLNNQKELEKFKETNKTTGIVRGADYYG